MKLFLKILAAICGVVVLTVVGLVLFLDANMFKPRIEAIAREQQVVLNIAGDMDWQLWPAFGIEINDVTAATTEAPEQPLARLGRASLRLALLPLFSGEVAVDHIVIDGAVIDLEVDSQGRGNWEALTAKPAEETELTTSDANEPAAAEEEAGSQLQLAVEQITIRNSALNFTKHAAAESSFQRAEGSSPRAEGSSRSAEGSVPLAEGSAQPPAEGAGEDGALRISLDDIHLGIEDLNLQGEAFPMALQWQAEFQGVGQADPVRLGGRLTQRIQLAENFDALEITDGALRLAVASGGPDSAIGFGYSVALRNLQDNPRYLGELQLSPINLRQLLEALGQPVPPMSADYPLTQVAMNASFTGSDSSLTLDPINLTLDRTELSGSLTLANFSTGEVAVVLQGGRINVDDYLPPAQTTEAPAEEATGDEPIIPLETVRGLNANVSVDFEEIRINKMPLQQVRLRLQAQDGLVTLEDLSAQAYQGTLAAKGSLDARGDTAQIQFESGIDNLQLEPLMTDLELNEQVQLSGAIQAAAQGNTAGVTLNQLTQNAVAEANFSGAEVRVAPINIEQKFCQIVDLVNQTERGEQSWPEFTPMRQLSGAMSLADGAVSVKQMTAAVEQLALGMEGVINFAENSYNLGLPLTLTATSTSADDTGCTVDSNYWLDRSLKLLRCKGSLEGLNPVSDCRPDASGLSSLVKDFAQYKLQEKHGEKIEEAEQKLDEKKQELEDKLEEKLQEQFGEEGGKKLEDRLKGLLGR